MNRPETAIEEIVRRQLARLRHRRGMILADLDVARTVALREEASLDAVDAALEKMAGEAKRLRLDLSHEDTL